MKSKIRIVCKEFELINKLNNERLKYSPAANDETYIHDFKQLLIETLPNFQRLLSCDCVGSKITFDVFTSNKQTKTVNCYYNEDLDFLSSSQLILDLNNLSKSIGKHYYELIKKANYIIIVLF